MEDIKIAVRVVPTEDNDGQVLDGDALMKKYCAAIRVRKYTYFGTDLLPNGMSQKKLKQFRREIREKGSVKLGFIISRSAGGTNDIEYVADVTGIISDGIYTKRNHVPICFKGGKNKTLFKMCHLEKKHIDTSMVRVERNNKVLSKSLEKGRCGLIYTM